MIPLIFGCVKSTTFACTAVFSNKAKKAILPKEKLLHDLKYSIARNDKSVFPDNSLSLHIEHVPLPVFLYYSILNNY